MTLNKLVVCPNCKSQLIINEQINERNAIASCKCNQYPIIEGIIIMKTPENREIVKELKQKKFEKVLVNLLAFSFSSKIFFKLTNRFTFIYKFLGFKKFITLLTFFSFPKSWANYLKKREKIPSFFLSLFSLNLIKKNNDIIVDLGCGTGNLCPHYYNHVKAGNLIIIDQSFLNLYIVRLFFIKTSTTLICADLNISSPIKKSSVDFIFVIDCLHYIKNKKVFLSGTVNSLKKTGILNVIHALNIDTPKDSYAMPINPTQTNYLLNEAGFKYSYFISNKKLWSALLRGKFINLSNLSKIDQSYAYNFFASKERLLKKLKMQKKYLLLMKKTKINYYQDPELLKISKYADEA